MKIKNIALRLLPDKLLSNLKKIHYVNSLIRHNENDEPDFKVIKNIVRRGDYVADIGANVGWYTKLLSHLVGDEGRVYSIEPIPLTFNLLTHCISKIGLANVELLNFAISDHEGSAVMEVPLYKDGGENFYQSQLIETKEKNKAMDIKTNSLKQYKVQLKSIDALFSDLPQKISFIKCDVEGHELAVIKGAQAVIRRSEPAWHIEISSDPDTDRSEAWELFRILQGHSYSAWRFDGENLLKRSKGDTSINYFFLKEKHLNLLRGSALSDKTSLHIN